MSEIRVGQNALLTAVKTAALAAPSKGSIPILWNVRLLAADGKLTVQGTDLDTTVTVQASCEGAGDITVPAKSFRDAVERAYGRKRGRKAKGAVDPMVTVCIEGTAVTVRGEGEVKLYGTSAADWPNLDYSPTTLPVFYQGAQLRSALEYVLPAVSKDETRFHLNGVCFSGLDLVATDGHRLHRVAGLPGVDGEHIIAQRALSIVAKVLKSYDGDVAAAFDVTRCAFTMGAVQVLTRKVDAQFPPYEQVIPSLNRTRITVEWGAFLAALSGASALASDTRGIKLEATAGHVVVSADNPEKGEFKRVLNALTEGADGYLADHFAAGFNPRYLEDALCGEPEENVTFQVDGELDPARVDTLGDYSTVRTAVIMPMRI